VAFALNLLLLFTTGVFIVQRGTRMEEMPIIVLMTAAPLVSLFATLGLKRWNRSRGAETGFLVRAEMLTDDVDVHTAL
jgi:hypothetical protein